IDALLLDKTPDDAEEWRLRLDGQAGLLLELGLVGRLAGLIVSRKARGDLRVAGRIEERRVDPVGDAPEVGASLAKHAVEPLPEFGCQDFLGVSLADRRDDVRGRDGPRYRICLVAVLDREARAREANKLEHLRAGSPLVREVVDREDGRGPGEPARSRRERNEQRRVP